jgi:hypothetical protein
MRFKISVEGAHTLDALHYRFSEKNYVKPRATFVSIVVSDQGYQHMTSQVGIRTPTITMHKTKVGSDDDDDDDDDSVKAVPAFASL